MKYKFFLLILIIFFPLNANAITWENDFTVDKYQYFYDGSNFIFQIFVNETPTTNCSYGNNLKSFYYYSSTINEPMKTHISVASIAKTTNLKIDIQSNGNCSSNYGKGM